MLCPDCGAQHGPKSKDPVLCAACRDGIDHVFPATVHLERPESNHELDVFLWELQGTLLSSKPTNFTPNWCPEHRCGFATDRCPMCACGCEPYDAQKRRWATLTSQ